MSYNPYGGRYTYGGTLKHGRKPISEGGMPNGFRADGSRPVGQKRRGMIIGTRPDGTLIYSYGPQSAGQKAINSAKLRNVVNGRPTSISAGQKAINSARLQNTVNGRPNNIPASQRQRNAYKLNAAVNGTTRSQQPKGQNLNAQMLNRDVMVVGERARNAAGNVKNWFDKRGDELRDTAGNVKNWFDKRGDELRDTSKNVGNWLNERRENIRKGVKSAYEAISNSDERKAYERAEANFRKNPTAENRKARNAAKKAYDSHLLTRLDLGVKKGARNVGNWLNDRGSDIRKGVDSAYEAVKRGGEAVGNAVSNQDERKAYERAEANFRKNPTAENRKARNDAKKAYDSHLATRLERGTKKVSRNVAKGAKDAWNYVKPGGELDRKAVEAVTGAGESIGKSATKIVRDARKFTADLVPGASDVKNMEKEYRSLQSEYNSLLRTNPKAAHDMEKDVEEARQAFVKTESLFNNSFAGKASNAISGKSKYTRIRK